MMKRLIKFEIIKLKRLNQLEGETHGDGEFSFIKESGKNLI